MVTTMATIIVIIITVTKDEYKENNENVSIISYTFIYTLKRNIAGIRRIYSNGIIHKYIYNSEIVIAKTGHPPHPICCYYKYRVALSSPVDLEGPRRCLYCNRCSRTEEGRAEYFPNSCRRRRDRNTGAEIKYVVLRPIRARP